MSFNTVCGQQQGKQMPLAHPPTHWFFPMWYPAPQSELGAYSAIRVKGPDANDMLALTLHYTYKMHDNCHLLEPGSAAPYTYAVYHHSFGSKPKVSQQNWQHPYLPHVHGGHSSRDTWLRGGQQWDTIRYISIPSVDMHRFVYGLNTRSL